MTFFVTVVAGGIMARSVMQCEVFLSKILINVPKPDRCDLVKPLNWHTRGEPTPANSAYFLRLGEFIIDSQRDFRVLYANFCGIPVCRLCFIENRADVDVEWGFRVAN